MTDQELAKELIRSGLVTLGQVQEAAQHRAAGKGLGEVLVEQGLITAGQLAEFGPRDAPAAGAAGEPAELSIDPEALQYLDEDTCKNLSVIPLAVDGSTLKVAMIDPNNLPAQDEISRVSGKRVVGVAASSEQITEAIARCYRTGAIGRAADAGAPVSDGGPVGQGLGDVQELLQDAPAVKVVNEILKQAVEMGASDIHLEPRENALCLRFRIDGVLRDPRPLGKEWEASIISRLKIMAGLDISENRLPQDGRFRETLLNRQIDFRTSTLPCFHGEKVVLRLLDKSALKTDLGDLGFAKDVGQEFEELVMRPQGMILVTGPTGSGKSTTLYAALNRCKSETKNVVTVEDPIEYQLEGINQTQVHPEIDLSFARQLRAILRQDPDTILVGEIRDYETAEMAFRAALTGHLVLSTLHTNDAASAPVRLLDMNVEPYLVAASVIAILAQRLVRTICPKCKEQYQPSDLDLARIHLTAEQAAKIKFYHGTGCNDCGHTGYSGRLGVYELMVLNEPIRKAVVAGATTLEIRKLAVQSGMKTMGDDGLLKVAKGLTTPEELARVMFEFVDEEEEKAAPTKESAQAPVEAEASQVPAEPA